MKYRRLFPVAKFIIVAPTEFDVNPMLRNQYIMTLSAEMGKNGMMFISQPSVSSLDMMFDTQFHLNEAGRTMRTKQLSEILKRDFNYGVAE